MKMLNKTELKNWTDALRANPDQQIEGRLVNDEQTGYCCLGKLCSTLGMIPDKLHGGGLGFEEHECLLPASVRDKSGLTTLGCLVLLGIPPLAHAGKIYENLADANDSGVPWLVIANHLDQYYPAADDESCNEN